MAQAVLQGTAGCPGRLADTLARLSRLDRPGRAVEVPR
jgi:hypothetical protein